MTAVRWGIAATGAIAQRFADGLSQTDDADLVAVASRTQEGADAFGARWSVPHRHGSYEALADDDEVDVVYVASPQSRHCADTILFLEAGRHVLCEKPFAMTEAEGRRMVAAAEANDRFLMEAIWSRFLPTYVALRRVLDGGRIGEPRLVEADFGFRLPVDPEHRLFDPERGGGALLDLGVYPLQLASLVLGAPDQVRAVGQVGTTGVDESVAAVLHHPGGALAVMKAAITVNLACTARIAGTEGSIELPAFMHCPHALTVRWGLGEEEVIEAPMEGEGLRYQVGEVHRCLEQGERESRVMPLAETLQIAATMDEIRAQLDDSRSGR